jgi:DNA polymerase-1
MKIGALDIEHSTKAMRPWMDGFYISCVAGADSDGLTALWWFDHNDINQVVSSRDQLNNIQKWIDSLDVVCAHNLKHDMNILRYHGINFENTKLHCTMVTEYLLSGQDTKNRRFSLEEVCKHYGLDGKIKTVNEYWNKGVDTYDVPQNILADYVIDDARKALSLYYKQKSTITQLNMGQLVKLHNEFTRVLSDIELNGLYWDTKKSEEIYASYKSMYIKIEERISSMSGHSKLNIGSNDQLSAFLYGGRVKISWFEWTTKEIKRHNATKFYEKKFEEEVDLPGLGFAPPKGGETSKDGVFKTDKGTISKLKAKTEKQKEAKTLLVQLSEVKKVAETLKGKRPETGLISKVQSDGCLHPNINQAVTSTGRPSSSDPNGQNLPRKGTSPIKECIIPRFDLVGQLDLSQIEWKAAGELSGDRMMIYEINRGIDQHYATGRDLFDGKGERVDWKVFNFRMIFGGTAYGFYMDQRMPNFTQKRYYEIVNAFEQKYHGLTKWQSNNIQSVLEGQQLILPTGRRFVFNKTTYREGIWQLNERQVKNYPVQGLAGGDLLPLVASIIRKGFIKYGLTSMIILTVYDSIVFDLLESELHQIASLCLNVSSNLSKYVESYFGWRTKVKRFGGDFEIGKSYGGLKKYETQR